MWQKPREARLPLSKVCYSKRKHLCAARPASPSWVLPNASSSSVCAGPTPPHGATSGTPPALQATAVPRVSSSAAREPPSSGRRLGRGDALPRRLPPTHCKHRKHVCFANPEGT